MNNKTRKILIRKEKDRSSWAIGGMTLLGLAVGFVLLPISGLLFVAALLGGIGIGIMISAAKIFKSC